MKTIKTIKQIKNIKQIKTNKTNRTIRILKKNKCVNTHFIVFIFRNAGASWRASTEGQAGDGQAVEASWEGEAGGFAPWGAKSSRGVSNRVAFC